MGETLGRLENMASPGTRGKLVGVVLVEAEYISVYYLFLYQRYMDNVYTQIAIHGSTMGPLVVGQSSSSPPQSWISTLAREY